MNRCLILEIGLIYQTVRQVQSGETTIVPPKREKLTLMPTSMSTLIHVESGFRKHFEVLDSDQADEVESTYVQGTIIQG